MKLIHFFRLIQMSIFQKTIVDMMHNRIYNDKMSYNNTYFFSVLVLFVMMDLI